MPRRRMQAYRQRLQPARLTQQQQAAPSPQLLLQRQQQQHGYLRRVVTLPVR